MGFIIAPQIYEIEEPTSADFVGHGNFGEATYNFPFRTTPARLAKLAGGDEIEELKSRTNPSISHDSFWQVSRRDGGNC